MSVTERLFPFFVNSATGVVSVSGDVEYKPE